MKMGRYLLGLILSVACGLIGSSVFGHEGHQPLPSKGVQVDTERGYVTLSNQAREAIGLAVEEVVVGDVASTLVAYAETVAPWQSKAFGSAQISGRITKLLVRPGENVSKGQIVAEMSSRELESVKLSYAQAKKELALNKQLLELTRLPAQQGAIPLQRLAEIENAYQQSQNDLHIARIRFRTLGLDARELDDENRLDVPHSVRSPIAGKVVHSDLSEGKFVEAFEHLFEIVNTDQVWIRIQVLEKDIHKLSVEQPIELSFPDSGAVLESKIDRIDAALDPQEQIGWAWATTSQPSVIPGLVGAAKIRITHDTNRLSVPLGSVYSDGLQTYVFVEEASTKLSAEYRKRNVKLGERTSPSSDGEQPQIEVVQGDVYPGDRVVVKGGHELSSLFFLGVLKLSDSDRTRLGIRTATATHRSIANALNLAAIATLPPEGRSVASSQLPGTIHSHDLSPGQKVKAGDVLMEIASPEFQSIQLDLLRITLDADLFQQRAQRIERASSDAFSRRVLLETINRADQLEQRKESLKRQLVSLGLTASEVDDIVNDKQARSFFPIRAMMDGYLVRWTGTLGETVVANQALAEIQNVEDIWIEAHVPIQDIQSFSTANVGQASVLSNPDIKFPVTVSRIGPTVSEITRTQRIWLTPTSLPDHFTLRDGMQLSVALQVLEGQTALVVPTQAILRDGLHAFVFVQQADGYVDRRRVTTGRSDGEWVEVLQGVSAGDEVIAAGGRELQTAFASLR